METIWCSWHVETSAIDEYGQDTGLVFLKICAPFVWRPAVPTCSTCQCMVTSVVLRLWKATSILPISFLTSLLIIGRFPSPQFFPARYWSASSSETSSLPHSIPTTWAQFSCFPTDWFHCCDSHSIVPHYHFPTGHSPVYMCIPWISPRRPTVCFTVLSWRNSPF